ncbi:hypothetical protein PMAYCL1PPCAC_27084, partial [Pristionchus mayeri]
RHCVKALENSIASVPEADPSRFRNILNEQGNVASSVERDVRFLRHQTLHSDCILLFHLLSYLELVRALKPGHEKHCCISGE